MIYPWLWITCPDAPCMNGFPYIYPPCTHILDLGWFRSKKSPWSYEKTHGMVISSSPRSPRNGVRHVPSEVYPLRPAALGVSSAAVRDPAAPAQVAASAVALVASLMRPRRMVRPRDQWNLEKKGGITVHLTFCWLWVFFWSKSTT